MPTERDFESYAQKQIREAMERGEFDDLAGEGAPIPDLTATGDPDWWARRLIERERARDTADEVRRRVRDELPHIRAMSDREASVARLAELSALVDSANEHLPVDERIDPVTF